MVTNGDCTLLDGSSLGLDPRTEVRALKKFPLLNSFGWPRMVSIRVGLSSAKAMEGRPPFGKLTCSHVSSLSSSELLAHGARSTILE